MVTFQLFQILPESTEGHTFICCHASVVTMVPISEDSSFLLFFIIFICTAKLTISLVIIRNVPVAFENITTARKRTLALLQFSQTSINTDADRASITFTPQRAFQHPVTHGCRCQTVPAIGISCSTPSINWPLTPEASWHSSLTTDCVPLLPEIISSSADNTLRVMLSNPRRVQSCVLFCFLVFKKWHFQRFNFNPRIY